MINHELILGMMTVQFKPIAYMECMTMNVCMHNGSFVQCVTTGIYSLVDTDVLSRYLAREIPR